MPWPLLRDTVSLQLLKPLNLVHFKSILGTRDILKRIMIVFYSTTFLKLKLFSCCFSSHYDVPKVAQRSVAMVAQTQHRSPSFGRFSFHDFAYQISEKKWVTSLWLIT